MQALQTRNIFKLIKYSSSFTRFRAIPVVFIRNRRLVNEKHCNEICRLGFYSYSTTAPLTELVDSTTFEKACEETLESLTEYFEEIIEKADNLKNADISYSSGVLTVNLGPEYGTYVINRQSPNRQIWLSSPISGPKRYDFVVKDNSWVYKHDGVSLHQLLQNEISKIVKIEVDFTNCCYSKVE